MPRGDKFTSPLCCVIQLARVNRSVEAHNCRVVEANVRWEWSGVIHALTVYRRSRQPERQIQHKCTISSRSYIKSRKAPTTNKSLYAAGILHIAASYLDDTENGCRKVLDKSTHSSTHYGLLGRGFAPTNVLRSGPNAQIVFASGQWNWHDDHSELFPAHDTAAHMGEGRYQKCETRYCSIP